MGCAVDHSAERNPTHHPRWGLVPALSSTVIGGAVLVIAIGVSITWLPTMVTSTLLIVMILALALSAACQAILGHRGRCWATRTVRWWLGPLGSLLDPFDAG